MSLLTVQRRSGRMPRELPSLRTILLLAVLTAPAVLGGCDEKKVAEQTVRPVKAMVVPAPATERVLTYSGTLVPRIETSLGFRVAGKILERYVNTGDRLQRGQKIARLDEKDLKLAENSARASAAAAKTRVEVAKDALSRANFLLPNGFIAKSAVDQRKLELDSAQSALDSAQDQLNQAINSTGYAILAADEDGIVTSVKAETGQVVGIGQAVITLAHTGDVEVAVSVPEQEIARLQTGNPAAMALWSAPEVNSSAKIREIAGAAESSSRTYGVRVAIDRPIAAMRLGMTVEVKFKVAQDSAQILLPLTALSEKDGKTLVFIASKDSETVASREVAIAGVTEDGARIASGLSGGEILITGGVQFLTDGMKVRLPKDVLTAVADFAAVQPHR